MLGEYLYFNGEKFPNPINPSKTKKAIENVNQSEAGTDLVVLVRPNKNSWSFKFNLSSRKKDILEALCLEESVTMKYMGKTYTVRVRDFQETLATNSEWIPNTDGLYECSVKVTEF